MDHLFVGLVPSKEERQEKFYYSEKILVKISEYLEKEPLCLRYTEVMEDGWFNKKESYIKRRLKYIRGEGIYNIAIACLYRSYNGKRISRYILFWLNESDIYYINKSMDFEGEQAAISTLSDDYQIINIDPVKKD